PTTDNRASKAAIGTIDSIVDDILRVRRSHPEGRDFLSLLLAARDDQGQGMSDRQLRDEIKTILVAGHETTGNALKWCLYHLSQHPEVLGKVEEEVHRVLGHRALTPEDAGHFPYVSMCLRESMRIYPPIWVVQRQALAKDVLLGYEIPAGA